MTFKDIIAYCLVIALGIILALHFAFFWMYGGVFIHESNKIILTIETAMSAAILGFGIERLVSSAHKTSKPTASTVSHRKMRGLSTTSNIFSWEFMREKSRAAIATATTVSVMPAQTTLAIDSDARYMENYTFKMLNGTEDSSDILVHVSDVERDCPIYTKVSQL
jgi:hypothetical protein